MVVGSFFLAFAGVFEGCFGKSGVQRVVFCGEVVVRCVADVVGGMRVFRRLKKDTLFNYFFCYLLVSGGLGLKSD